MAKITVQDAGGNDLGTFDANASDSIANQGAAAGVIIPVACGTGACGICVATVAAGSEFVDAAGFGSPSFPVGDDQILTCVSGVNGDAPADAEITLLLPNA